MKNKYVFVTLLLTAAALLGLGFTWGYGRLEAEERKEELLVVTSFYPMYVAALNVAGGCEGVTVENLSEPQTGCLHDFQLTPEDMRLLSEADVFVINGGGMESFLTEVAREYPGLAIIDAGAAVFSGDHAAEEETAPAVAEDAASAVAEDAAHAAEEESGHAHSENAHAWMSIGHYREQIAAIRDGLMETDPAHAAYYEAQAEAYLSKINDFAAEAESLKTMTQGQPVLLFHEAFAYLAEDYGLIVEGILNLDEERQVSAGEVADLMELIEREKIQIILAEALYGRDMGDTIEAETDCKVYYLDTLTRADSGAEKGEAEDGAPAGDAEKGEAEDGAPANGGAADSWLRGMERNLEILREAFGAKSAQGPEDIGMAVTGVERRD